MRKIAQAKARGAALHSDGMTTDKIQEIVKSAAILQETMTPKHAPPIQMLYQGKQSNISGSDDATHGHSGQSVLDAIAAAAEEELTDAERKATEDAASQEKLLPPEASAQALLLQEKSDPAVAHSTRSEDPQRPKTGGKNFHEWVAEQEEAPKKPVAGKGEMRKSARGKSLVQMTKSRYTMQLHEEDKAQTGSSVSNLRIGAEEKKRIMARIARAQGQGIIHPSKDLSEDSIKEIVKSVLLFQELTPSISNAQEKDHLSSRQANDPDISGTEDAAHGHRSQDILDEIAAAEEEKLTEVEQKASEEAASQERLLPPNQTALMQKKSRPAVAGNIGTEDPQKPSTNGKDFYEWVAEREQAESQKGVKKGEMRKPAKGKSLVQMTNKKNKVQLHEEDGVLTGEESRFATTLHITAAEEQAINARIAQAKVRGVIHPSKDLTEESIKEIVMSALQFQQLTPSIAVFEKKEHKRLVNDPDVSGTEDAAHGHRSQDILDEIAAAEEEKLTEAEQKASEEAAKQERLLPPNQTALMQKKSRSAMTGKIRTEDPQKPSTNGKDFYDWIIEQEEAETKSRKMDKPAKGSSLVQMANTQRKKTKLHDEDGALSEEDKGERFASSLHISAEEERHILSRIARAKAEGTIHQSKDLTEAKIREIVNSVALLHESSLSISSSQKKRHAKTATDPDISGTEDATHGHSAQDMLDAIAAAEEEKLSDEEKRASEEAASQERLLPPNNTALMQKKSRTVIAAQILTEEPQRPNTNGEDFYNWVAEQEEGDTEAAADAVTPPPR